MKEIKRKIILFLCNDYYLFWALGLTAGVYTGGISNPCNIYMTAAGVTAVAVLLIIEIIAAGKFLLEKNSSGFLKGKKFEKDTENDCKFLPGSKSPPDSEKKNTGLFITTVIPFLILFFIGNLIIRIYDFRETKNIISAIYQNENSAAGNSGAFSVIYGRVSDHPSRSYGNLNFTLAVDKIFIYDSGRDPDGFIEAGEHVVIKLNNASGGFISRDDYLRIKGSFKETDLKNLISGRQENKEIFFKAGEHDAKKIGCSSPGYKIFIFRSKLYNCLKNAFYRNLENVNACIAEAVILGNRNSLPSYLVESFKRCGVYHLFAISGLHLSFFTSLIYLISKRVRSSDYILGAVIIFLIIYNFLVGERASMLRASIAVIFIFLAGRWNREYSHKIILYLSYIILIIYNPYFIYNTGFWMTFGSMAALAFIYPFMLKAAGGIFIFKSSILNFFAKIIFITLSIQVVLFPVIAYFFNEVSLISPLANILIIPAFYILLSIMIFSSAIIIIWPPAGGFFLKSSVIFFKYILRTVKILSRFDLCIISFNSFTVRNMVAYYMVFLILIFIIYVLVKITGAGKGKF